MEGPRKSISEFMHKVSERVDMRRRCSSPFRSPPDGSSGSPAGQSTPQSPPRGEFICRELNQALLHILLPPVEANGCDGSMGNRVAVGSGGVVSSEEGAGAGPGADEPDDLELPPPMPVLEDPASTTATSSAAAAAAADAVAAEHEEHTESDGGLSSSGGGRTEPPDPGAAAPSGGDPATAQAGSSEDETEEDQNRQLKALRKRSYVIQELVDTEREYIRSLGQIVDDYLRLMRDDTCPVPLPEDLISDKDKMGKDKIIFGNIEAIYEWHRDFFLKALERCIEHPTELGPLFKRYERKLHMYVVYCQNKPKSEYIVSEHIDTYFEELRKLLNQKHQLTDLLIQPIQRIMRYKLLLKEILRHTEVAGLTEEAEALQKAVHVMTVVPEAANDMMNVGRLQGFDGKITAQGKLLKYGPLMCCEGASAANFRGKEHIVFLFEQNVIFSESIGRRTAYSNPGYVYKCHIQVNKMSLTENVDDGDALKFCLSSTDPQKRRVAWLCQGRDDEDRGAWVRQLRSMLQTQQNFLKAIQSPIAFQKELTKEVGELGYGSLKRGGTLPSSFASAGHLPLDNGATTGQLGNYSLPGSPTNSAAPPLPPTESSVSVSEARKLSLQTEKKTGGFLTGFKKTLRSRKTETSLLYSPPEAEGSSPFGAGAQVCVVTPYSAVCEDETDLQRGDLVQILQYNRSRGYLVHRAQSRACPAAEGWVPPHVLAACASAGAPAGPRTAWAFRFRRPSSGSGSGSGGGHGSSPVPPAPGVVQVGYSSMREVKRHSSDQTDRRRVNVRLMEPGRTPCRLRRAPSDVTVYAGETVVLTCCVSQPAELVAASWRDPWGRKVAGGRAWHTVDDDGTCRLTIQGAESGDSGEYVCEVVADGQVLRAAATVTVVADMT